MRSFLYQGWVYIMGEHFVADIPQKVIIPHRGKILVVQDIKGVWQLPGGRINTGEKPIEGLRREIREELGIEIVPKSIFDTYVFTSVSGTNHFVVVYLCEVGSDDLARLKLPDGEIKNVRWVGEKEIDAVPMLQDYKEVLRKYFSKNV